MVLNAIAVGQDEENLRSEILSIAEKYARAVVRKNKKNDTEESKNEPAPPKYDDVVKMLHTVFKPNFVSSIIFNLDVKPPIEKTVSDLIPHLCNFPTEMTLRTKNFHGNGVAPCRRRLHKDHVYFCTLAPHMKYAEVLKLPITYQDAVRMCLSVPPRPSEDQRQPHVRLKRRHRRIDKRTGEMKIVGDVQETESYPHTANKISIPDEQIVKYRTVMKNVQESRHRRRRFIQEAIQSSKNTRQMMDVDVEAQDLSVVPFHQCTYVDLVTGKPCTSHAIHADPWYGSGMGHCDEHVKVSEKMVESIRNLGDVAHDNDEILDDLETIRDMDVDLYDWIDNVKADVKDGRDAALLSKRCRDRYDLGVKYGIGMDPKLVQFLCVDG